MTLPPPHVSDALAHIQLASRSRPHRSRRRRQFSLAEKIIGATLIGGMFAVKFLVLTLA